MPFPNFGAIISDFISAWLPWNGRQDPEWLKSLLGDSPLLGRSEYEFISQVRNSIIEEARSSTDAPPNQHMRSKLSVIRGNFEEVAAYLRENSRNKNYFLRNYPPWRSCRDLSILELINISRTVNNNNKDSASTRCFGNTVSLAGGLMCLVPGLGAIRLAGGVLMGLGSLVAAGASIIEFALLKEKIKEAEKIMLKDREYSERLWNWMSDMTHMQEAYNIITSTDINLKNIAADLHAHFKSKSSTPGHLKMIILKAVKTLKFSHGMIDDICDVIGMLLAIFMLYDRYRPLFNIAFQTYKCKRILCTAYDVAASAVKMASVVNAGASPFPKYRFGIGIALDVIGIIQATKDFEETSKESIAIAEAAKKLQEEAEIFKKLYDAINRA